MPTGVTAAKIRRDIEGSNAVLILLSETVERLKHTRAIIEEPNSIGGFVSTLPSPFKRYPGVQHRIFLRETAEPKLLFAEIQLFASAGTPTYSVIIGALDNDGQSTSRIYEA